MTTSTLLKWVPQYLDFFNGFDYEESSNSLFRQWINYEIPEDKWELTEDGGSKLKLSVPGLNKDYLKAEIVNNIFSISYDPPKETKEKDFEFTYQKWLKKWKLGKTVLPEDIIIEYKNGILVIFLKPSKEEEKKKVSIPIK